MDVCYCIYDNNNIEYDISNIRVIMSKLDRFDDDSHVFYTMTNIGDILLAINDINKGNLSPMNVIQVMLKFTTYITFTTKKGLIDIIDKLPNVIIRYDENINIETKETGYKYIDVIRNKLFVNNLHISECELDIKDALNEFNTIIYNQIKYFNTYNIFDLFDNNLNVKFSLSDEFYTRTNIRIPDDFLITEVKELRSEEINNIKRLNILTFVTNIKDEDLYKYVNDVLISPEGISITLIKDIIIDEFNKSSSLNMNTFNKKDIDMLRFKLFNMIVPISKRLVTNNVDEVLHMDAREYLYGRKKYSRRWFINL